jgi:hypothetical protein
MLRIVQEIDDNDEPPSMSKTHGASVFEGSMGSPRIDSEKRQAQVLDFFLFVIRELEFFAEADDS